MKDKEMIEEMEKDIRDSLMRNFGKTNLYYYLTRDLLALGYIKTEEGSVVLTIEEVDEYRKDRTEVKFLKNKIIEKTRKETAETILKTIKKAKEYGQIYYNDDFMITAQKAYGVEV